jgi:hypothetical protein
MSGGRAVVWLLWRRTALFPPFFARAELSLLLLVLQGDITLEFTWVDSSGECH